MIDVLRFLADENFNGRLFKGLCAALPGLDVLRVQDAGLEGTPDPELLEWAAEQGRILFTHDVRTLAGFAYDRVKRGLAMPGIVEVRIAAGFDPTLDDIILLVTASVADEFENQVRYIPRR